MLGLMGISLGDDQEPAARGSQRWEVVTSVLATLSQKEHSLRKMPDAVFQAYEKQKAGLIPATDVLLQFDKKLSIKLDICANCGLREIYSETKGSKMKGCARC